jgi:hypothetical protein
MIRKFGILRKQAETKIIKNNTLLAAEIVLETIGKVRKGRMIYQIM